MLPMPTTPGEALLIQQNTMLFQENCVRSQKEQALYAAWKNAVEENNNLKILIKTPQTQSQEMRSDIANLKGANDLESTQGPTTTEYFTDEEELEKETGWILQTKRNAKRRKMETSPCTSKHVTSEQPMQQPSGGAIKTMKPPPIIIYQVRDYDTIYKYLNTTLELNFKITLLNNGDLKLNVDPEEHYRTASKMLTEAQFLWSTYENKQTRPIRVVVRKLHSSCTPDQIVHDLRQNGYQIIEAVNILK